MKSDVKRLLKGEGLLAIPVAIVGANSALSIPGSILAILSLTGAVFGVPMLVLQAVICWFAWLYVRATLNGAKMPVPARVAAYGFVATTVVLLVLFSILYLTAHSQGNDEGFVELGLFIWLSLVLVAALVAYFVLSIFGIAGLKNMAKEDIEKLESKKPAFIVKANAKAKQFNGRVHGVFHEERQLSKSPWVKAVAVTVTILLLVVIVWALSTQLDNGYAPGMY